MGFHPSLNMMPLIQSVASTRIKCIETISHPDDNMRPANDNCIRHVHPASSAFFLSINIERPVFTKLLVLLHHLTFVSYFTSSCAYIRFVEVSFIGQLYRLMLRLLSVIQKLLKIEEQFQFLITRPIRLIGMILFAENEMPVIWNVKIVQ
ncbi:hypothetical protein T06_6748 [Trichinella sp. T6]|nr:hypothetical protein T06_6748 [Trichinella sp. T6]